MQAAAKLVKPTIIFPDATPCNIVSRLSISEDSAIWAAFRRHKKVGTLGFPKRESFVTNRGFRDLLDMTTPGMNGFETAAHMPQIAPAVKIIFYSIHEIPTIARLSGEGAFVSKSSSPEELTTTINRALYG